MNSSLPSSPPPKSSHPRTAAPKRAPASAARSRRHILADSGDTLIEVVASAFILGLIVVATFTGLEGSTRAAALGRARSQAQALAEQDEERLRGDSIEALTSLSEASTGESRVITENGTKFTIKSTVATRNEETSVSCTSGTPSVDAFRTLSEVEWHPSPPHEEKVKEASLIARPPGVNLIVQVNNAAGTGVPGMTVTSTQKSTGESESGTTDSTGCKLFTSNLEGGAYDINAFQSEYVDQNWYKELKEDPHAQTERTLVAGITTRASFEFAKRGQLAVNLLTGEASKLGLTSGWAGQAWNAIASNSSRMSVAYKPLLAATNAELASEITSAKEQAGVFPLQYSVYAGGCTGNNPTLYGATAETPTVVSNETKTVTLTLPALRVHVYKGTSGTSEPLITERPKIVIREKTTLGEGCAEKVLTPETVPVIPGTTCTGECPSALRGSLRYPGLPFGKYSVCLEHAGKHYRKAADETELTELAEPKTVTLYWGEVNESGSC